MPSFRCTDIGLICAFQANAKSEEELMRKIAEHVAKTHHVNMVPPELTAKIKRAIKK